jgi:uncharacterized membrane protein YsdA (DUF1294 family)
MSIAPVVAAVTALLLFNVAVFFTWLWDKYAAARGHQRVRESTLLWLALLGGSPGALIAQRRLRHKTRKEPFRSRLAAIVRMQLAILFLAFAFAFIRLFLPDAAERFFAVVSNVAGRGQ